MTQQILVIQGGTSFNSDAEYQEFIKTRDLTLDSLQQFNDWKFWLPRDLGAGWQVLLPKMPNTTNARYQEWRVWFERCLNLLDDNAILIGHSLGGIFLAKYLAEQESPKSIKATILVAAPFNDTLTPESLREFMLPESLDKCTRQAGQLHLVHSTDDFVVPFEQLALYQKQLLQAEAMTFTDRGHFNQESFPEIVELLKSLADS